MNVNEMQIQIQEQAEQVQAEIRRKMVVFGYRNNLNMPGATITVLLSLQGNKIVELEPVYRKRSRSGAHGDDYYTLSYLLKQNVVAIVKIDVSNSGKHYCWVKIEKSLTPLDKARILKYITEKVHDCYAIQDNIEEIDIKEYLKAIAK